MSDTAGASATPPVGTIQDGEMASSGPPLPVKISGWKSATTRKRLMRKDRHSKIHTAQGARDRRMRLSLEVARKFFDLQDLLGFDKPSKTIQWLLTKSKSAIKDIAGSSQSRLQTFSGSITSLKSESSTLECDDVSIISDYKGKCPAAATATSEANYTSQAKRVGDRRSKKAAVHSEATRESRAKARARARERTRAKKIRMQCGLLESDASPEKLQVSPFETIEEESISQDPKSSLELAAAEIESPNHYKEPLINERVLENLLMITVGSELIPMFNYQLNTASNIEQWEMQLPSNIEERILLADAQLHEKPWEAYNYPPL